MSILILRSVIGISMYSYIDQGVILRGFPILATFVWTILTLWAKTWKIRISKINQKLTCWFSYLEVSMEFPCTLISNRGLYWGVSTIFGWTDLTLSAKTWKIRSSKINMLIFILRSIIGISMYSYFNQEVILEGFPHF